MADETGNGEDVQDKQHPIAALWNRWKPLSKKNKESYDFSSHANDFKDFFYKLGKQPFCKFMYNPGRITKCNCMNDTPITKAEEKRSFHSS